MNCLRIVKTSAFHKSSAVLAEMEEVERVGEEDEGDATVIGEREVSGKYGLDGEGWAKIERNVIWDSKVNK